MVAFVKINPNTFYCFEQKKTISFLLVISQRFIMAKNEGQVSIFFITRRQKTQCLTLQFFLAKLRFRPIEI